MNYSKIGVFLVLAFGLSWLGLKLPDIWLADQPITQLLVQLLAYSWGPALATLITQRYIFQGSMARYGWNRKRYSFNWILVSLLIPLGLVLATVGAIAIGGNLLHIPAFGEIALQQTQEFFNRPEIPMTGQEILSYISAIEFLPLEREDGFWTLLMLGIVLAMVGGASLNLLFNVGEEVGWRGFMIAETRSMGFMGSNLVIGVLHGLWQLPLVFHFGAFLGIDSLVDILSIVGFSISMAYPMAYLAMKTRSIYASATFLGVFNNLSQLTLLFIVMGNPYIASTRGLIGMMLLMGVTYLIIRRDSKFIDRYQDFAY